MKEVKDMTEVNEAKGAKEMKEMREIEIEVNDMIEVKEVNEEIETEANDMIEANEMNEEIETEANDMIEMIEETEIVAIEWKEETETETEVNDLIDLIDLSMSNRRIVRRMRVNRVVEVEVDAMEAIVEVDLTIIRDSTNSFLPCLFHKEAKNWKIAEQLN